MTSSLVGSEMCIRDRVAAGAGVGCPCGGVDVVRAALVWCFFLGWFIAISGCFRRGSVGCPDE
eukprot:9620113-Prorocentrum_lima.AAC.1